jgi:hypothetical protein
MAKSSCFKDYERCATGAGPLEALDCAVDLLGCLNKVTGGRGGRRGGDRAVIAALRGLQQPGAAGRRATPAMIRSASAGLQPAQAALLEDVIDLLKAIDAIATKS